MLVEEVKRCVEKYYPKGIEIRRRIHQYPELSEQEVETAGLAAAVLRELGIETRCGIAGNGVLGIIHGAKPGKTVLLRADMDALAIDEAADVPFKSKKPGVMHACGHDGHTAGLLMAAMALNELKDRFSGTVKLLFQPAEETVGGAERMIAAGVLENPRVDAAFGCHLWGPAEEGTVLVKSGPLMASPDEFAVTLSGAGGHGAMPHLTADPALMTAQAIVQFQSIISRRKDPLEPAVLSVCMVHGGSAFNVIPESMEMRGTIRTFSKELRDFIPQEMEKTLKAITLTSGGTYKFELKKLFPPLVNDAAAADFARKSAEKLFGKERVKEAVPSMGGDDFAYFSEKIPSCYFFVGIAPKGSKVIHHSPYFKWDEKALQVSAACLCQTALDYLSV
ncbi:MAG: amidohydrolase [Spirochaetaceae bacterium]|jgi:amidohydrolase|nr:amidohydrolase [Spirochaetaceae bacterium]